MQLDRSALVAGVGMGVATMYLLDPDRGRRRRAVLRDKMVRGARVGVDGLGVAGRDLAHRASGAAARVKRLARHESVDDQVLAARVRAQLGRYVSHPRALEISASNGVVTLRGPILEGQITPLLRAIEHIPGVRDIAPELEEHSTSDIPALQGGTTPPSARSNVWPGRWSPATRLLTGSLAALAAVAVARNSAVVARGR
jgi:osmotically-inducible protein OsmY